MKILHLLLFPNENLCNISCKHQDRWICVQTANLIISVIHNKPQLVWSGWMTGFQTREQERRIKPVRTTDGCVWLHLSQEPIWWSGNSYLHVCRCEYDGNLFSFLGRKSWISKVRHNLRLCHPERGGVTHRSTSKTIVLLLTMNSKLSLLWVRHHLLNLACIFSKPIGCIKSWVRLGLRVFVCSLLRFYF